MIHNVKMEEFVLDQEFVIVEQQDILEFVVKVIVMNVQILCLVTY